LYQTSSRHFNEEVDFFNFLAESDTRCQVQDTAGIILLSIVKKRELLAVMELLAPTMVLEVSLPTTVLKVQTQSTLEVQARTTLLEVYGNSGSIDGHNWHQPTMVIRCWHQPLMEVFSRWQ